MNSAKRLLVYLFREHLIWFLLVALCVVGWTIPGFFSTRNILNVLWASAPLGCMVLGMYFMLLIGSLDLSLESIFAFGPTLALVMMQDWLPGIITPSLAIVLTLILGILAGLFNGLFSVYLGVNAFLVTLATLLTLRGVVIYLIPEGIYYLPEGFTFLGGNRIFGSLPIAVVIFLLLYAVAYVVINFHRFGKDVFAIGNNEEAAYLAGVNIDRVKVSCFVIAGLLSAIGGLLEVGRLQSVVADLGEGDILMVFAGAILGGTSLMGGVGKVTSVFAAVLVIAIIENIMNLIGVPPSIRQVIFGLILLGAIYITSLQTRLQKAT